MDKYLIYIFIAFIVLSVIDVITRKIFNNQPREIKKSKYRYFAKNYVMTQRENEFFKLLNDIFGSKWYVVPQVHLSALLNHKVKGQNWKSAFNHINGKSVDFVLIGKDTMKTICAIELDDSSHNSAKRQERDEEVERIFAAANIPLARFRNPEKMSRQEIVETVTLAIKQITS